MQIYVVVGVYAGIVDRVSAWTSKARAEAERDRLSADYGIIPTLEGESAHTVVVYEIPLRTDQ